METPDPSSDTPGASKQVVLTPHDIPRILRVSIYFPSFGCINRSSQFVSDSTSWSFFPDFPAREFTPEAFLRLPFGAINFQLQEDSVVRPYQKPAKKRPNLGWNLRFSLRKKRGRIKWDPFGGIKQCKYMVLLRDFPYNIALFGLVI